MITFKILKSKYDNIYVDGIGRFSLTINLYKGGNVHKGINELEGHKWYRYDITSEQSDFSFPFGYKGILVTPYYVTENLRNSVVENVIESGCTFENAPLPNIDGKTGNIHNESFNKESINDCLIAQIVAMGRDDVGPIINDTKRLKVTPKGYYPYNCNKKVTKDGTVDLRSKKCFFVPKTAYYPLEGDVSDICDEESKLLYLALKTIFEILNDEKGTDQK